jgi:hypothetical protein
MDADADELHDLAALPVHGALLAKLDAALRVQLGDYDAIDKEVMANDKDIYQVCCVAV